MNMILIGNLNINSILNKFDQLKLFVRGKVDILVTVETKLDLSFPTYQFLIEGSRITLIETGTMVGFLFMFKRTYQVNF